MIGSHWTSKVNHESLEHRPENRHKLASGFHLPVADKGRLLVVTGSFRRCGNVGWIRPGEWISAAAFNVNGRVDYDNKRAASDQHLQLHRERFEKVYDAVWWSLRFDCNWWKTVIEPELFIRGRFASRAPKCYALIYSWGKIIKQKKRARFPLSRLGNPAHFHDTPSLSSGRPADLWLPYTSSSWVSHTLFWKSLRSLCFPSAHWPNFSRSLRSLMIAFTLFNVNYGVAIVCTQVERWGST